MRMTLHCLLKKVDKCAGHFLFKAVSQVVLLTKNYLAVSLRKKCPYLELFWSAFFPYSD